MYEIGHISQCVSHSVRFRIEREGVLFYVKSIKTVRPIEKKTSNTYLVDGRHDDKRVLRVVCNRVYFYR